ncbi:MAG: M28 family peptidase [Gemmatimonadaceae bacterium]|nr:M28 family peptidase [Gemmatimonadaceae bacterium]
MRIAVAAVVATPFASPAQAIAATTAAITAADLRTRLYLIADDSLRGRLAGTAGDSVATAYIASELARAGLEPAGENGGWFQAVHFSDRGKEPAVPARNVIGLLRGSDPVLRNEYVVVSAHNDHVGVARQPVDHDALRVTNFAAAMRKRGVPAAAAQAWASHALDSIRALRAPRQDSIFNGADDDGSGTVSLLEIAEAMASMPNKPKRSILFISHTAEEEGLYGSGWFTEHPTVPRDSLVAELDMDMVGRGSAADVEHGGPTYLELIGTRRLSTELGDVAEKVNAQEPMPFAFNYAFDKPGDREQYYCRADHYSYARFGIPSINFSRGDHPDYHEVTDEPQYIDYDAMARVAGLVRDLAFTLANLDHRVAIDHARQKDPYAACVQ